MHFFVNFKLAVDLQLKSKILPHIKETLRSSKFLCACFVRVNNKRIRVWSRNSVFTANLFLLYLPLMVDLFIGQIIFVGIERLHLWGALHSSKRLNLWA